MCLNPSPNEVTAYLYRWTRRNFIKASLGLAGGLLLPTPSIAATDTRDFWTRPRTLWLKRKETGEEFNVEFWTPEAGIDAANYVRLCYLMRDVQEDMTVTIDANLFSLFYGIQYWDFLLTGKLSPYIITSGHRTIRHNSRTEGAAKNSLHIHGRAGDGYLLNRSVSSLIVMGSFFRVGGIGVYETFAHFDTGSLRFWDGKKQKTAKTHLLTP